MPTPRSSNDPEPNAPAQTEPSTGGHDEARRSEIRVAGPSAGDVLGGKYRLLHLLGSGGMGSIWRAQNTLLEVDVAVKIVRRDTTPEACERLLREARATARIDHPSIVRILDFGTSDAGEPYLVMELLDGGSLGDWLDEHKQLPAATAAQILLPVASALAAVHARGVVHRDIKPENIVVVAGDGGTLVPKIVDFGIVKFADERPRRRALTGSGAVIGSPEYMSPEQTLGEEVGPATDVWALSVVLYELVTGERPFKGATIHVVLYAIYHHEPDASAFIAAADEDLWAIVRRGLAKKPEERWPSVTELGQALAAWLVDRGIATDVMGTSITNRWLNPEPIPSSQISRPSLASIPSPLASPDARTRDTLESPAQRPSAGGSAAESDEAVVEELAPAHTPGPQALARRRRARALALATLAIGSILAVVAASRGGRAPVARTAATAAPPATATTPLPARDAPGATSDAPARIDPPAPIATPAASPSGPPPAPPASTTRARGGGPGDARSARPSPAQPKGMPLPDQPNF